MSTLEKLIALGAQVAAGDVILKNKLVGTLRNGEFYPTELGLEQAEIEEAVIKTETKRPRAKAKAEADAGDDADVTIDV